MTSKRSNKPDRDGKGAPKDAGKENPAQERFDETIPLIVPVRRKDAFQRSGKLLVLSGSQQGREFVLSEDGCCIGSGPANEVVLDDGTVSRRHCGISFTPKGCLIRDLGSTNGTFVHGVKISEAFLDHGTEFCLGKTSLVFCSLKDSGVRAVGAGQPPGKRSDASLAIQKFSSRGIGYSVADWSNVRHVFAAAVPRRGTTLAEQADDALRIIETVNSVHGAHGTIVHQSVFVPDPALIDKCRRIIREFYGRDLPATSYIAQPPCEGKLIAIEALGLGTGRGDVKVERISEQLVIARHNRMTWAYAAPVARRTKAGLAYEQGMNAFRKLRELLHGVDMRLDHVVRTWLYMGGIVADEGETQRYRELNRARTDAYAGVPFLCDLLPKGHPTNVYPASTGIGIEGRGLELSAMALATDRSERPGRAARKSEADRGVLLRCPLQSPEPQVLAGDGRHLRPVRDDLRLRNRQHHGLGDAPRRRRGGPDAGDPGQHRGADRRGESYPPRPAGSGHDTRRDRAGARVHQTDGRLRAGAGGLRGTAGGAADGLRRGGCLPAGPPG